MQPGPLNLITDVTGLKVGNAQDRGLKSGVTVLTADAPFVASCHVMGGAPGTRETDLLAPDKTVDAVDALVLSGGSAFGLDAASGVVEGLRAAGRGFEAAGFTVPIVPAAILFDLANGGEKNWTSNPYPALGRIAYDNASEGFSLGSAGAGTGALTARLKGGLGSASWTTSAGHRVGALVAANPVGSVTPPGVENFWAAPFEWEGEFGGLGGIASPVPALSLADTKLRAAFGERESTTIAIVATDAALTKAELHRLAVAAHDGFARAIVPSHTPMDGDLVFALSTGRRPLSNNLADAIDLGHAAATCLSRAIARAVYEAAPEAGDIHPCWKNQRYGPGSDTVK